MSYAVQLVYTFVLVVSISSLTAFEIASLNEL